MDASFATQQEHDVKAIDQIRHEISSYLRAEMPELDVQLVIAGKSPEP
jgi:hypothetical protein